ncbi:hypothetical protein [Runella slithyformis]|uniref:Uncharacterized protein n=1 Tax=Runella slithyformis (strain ATCC 29530 / DSM 19594 / LMG 11500 / NCIMB 11436 / LSU 4) TaxID=761193 RepID=A0A7U4E894_RUNSL|nr:hypothetical protein [Runella slithyformis]AEI51204.1 hypothetical protein Runsl_4894 [Runella slithyformis DSM 19594]
MAAGTKTGGRTKGTPNRLTKEIRAVLKDVIGQQLESMPDILETLQPKEKLEFIIKLMPYVLPKVETVKMNDGEGLNFDW